MKNFSVSALSTMKMRLKRMFTLANFLPYLLAGKSES